MAPTQKISDDAPYPTSGPASIPPQNYQPGPASIPPQNNYHSGPASVPPQNYQPPASVPPQNYQPPASVPPQNASIPPQNASIPPRASTQPPATQPPAAHPRAQSQRTKNGAPSISRRQTPAFSDPSITPPPRRRWGLIITVLVIDLALAGAGVYLLTEGLA